MKEMSVFKITKKPETVNVVFWSEFKQSLLTKYSLPSLKQRITCFKGTESPDGKITFNVLRPHSTIKANQIKYVYITTPSGCLTDYDIHKINKLKKDGIRIVFRNRKDKNVNQTYTKIRIPIDIMYIMIQNLESCINPELIINFSNHEKCNDPLYKMLLGCMGITSIELRDKNKHTMAYVLVNNERF